MAGIGFVLRKLTRRGDLLGVLEGYGHSALASTGPWLFTIFALVGINLLTAGFLDPRHLADFRIIVIYNFAFSLALTGPIVMVATRYLSDLIFACDVQQAPGLLASSLGLAFVTQVVVVVPFYLFVVHADAATKLAAIAHFFLVTAVWIVAVFVTALKDHRVVTISFASGMFLSMVGTVVMARGYGVAGMLAGFSLGLVFIVFMLAGRILIEYRFELVRPVAFLGYFRKYWMLALSGLVYNVAIWVDKWVFWFSPQREHLANGLICYPDYDSGMFLACLSMAPAMGLFVLSVETDFFEHYQRYYRDIQGKATLAQIEWNHGQIVTSIFANTRTFVLLQLGMTVTMIALAPQLFTAMNLNFSQFGIFRLGVLGAFFHVQILFVSILLSYFELHREVLRLQMMLLITNALFSGVTMWLGVPYYGLGYCLAGILTSLAGLFVLLRNLKQLPYVSFVLANPSIR
jgi:uncharacterized membrane protein